MFDVHSEDAETGPSVLSTLGRKACLEKKTCLTCVCPAAGTAVRGRSDLCDAPRIVPISVKVLNYIGKPT
jgi:hypothetical protein